MRKRITLSNLAVFVTVAAILLAAGCGGTAPAPTAEPTVAPPPTAAPTVAPSPTPEEVVEASPTPEVVATSSILDEAAEYFGDGMQLSSAEAVFDNLNDGDDSNDPVIIDIRSADDYALGHIPGAVNMGAGAVFASDTLAALPMGGQVVIVCYSGQTAGQVTSALNMLGYDTHSLTYGMPAWALVDGVTKGLWDDDMSQGYPADTEPYELMGDYDLPEPLGADVAEAAAAYFGDGMKLITAEAVYDNLNDGDEGNDPLLVDIRSADDYALGHVPGAVSLGAGSIFSAETLASFPTDGQIVVVCYSGQTAGQVTSALNMLGYDAQSMTFGMKAWAMVDGVTKGLWTDDMSQGYPVSTEPAELGDVGAPVVEVEEAFILVEAGDYFGDGMQLISAEAVYDNLNDGDDSNDPVVIDIRSADDYALGHIPGAVNLGAGAVFASDTLAALPMGDQVVIVCYSGQTAGQVTSALNMLGYDAHSLTYGMPSWAIVEGITKGLWDDDMSEGYPVNTESSALMGDYELPEPLGATVAEAAVAYFGDGMKLITAEAVYDNLNDGDESNDPLIVDIRSADDYALGDVADSVNLGAGSIFSAETLAGFPTDGQIVVYCYSGQTAGQVVSALNMLGYDAHSMTYGMKAWEMVEGVTKGLWSDDMSQGYPVSTDPAELP